MTTLRFPLRLTTFAIVASFVGCTEQTVSTDSSPQPEILGWLDIPKPAEGQLVPPHHILFPSLEGLDKVHTVAVSEFVSANGFGHERMPVFTTRHGYVPNSQQWAKKGQYHFPELDANLGGSIGWELKSLQLVGLMKDTRGVVYQIPAGVPMNVDGLKQVPTRPLDAFETDALPRLFNNLATAYVEDDRVRMLGAIRVTNDCRQCHQQSVGTILGAFAYDFVRSPEPYVAPDTKSPASVERIPGEK